MYINILMSMENIIWKLCKCLTFLNYLNDLNICSTILYTMYINILMSMENLWRKKSRELYF